MSPGRWCALALFGTLAVGLAILLASCKSGFEVSTCTDVDSAFVVADTALYVYKTPCS